MKEEPDILLGIDVGSATVKCVAVEAESHRILWQAYERHRGQQAEKLLDMLERMERNLPHVLPDNSSVFITGSGAAPLAEALGASFVQEVNAVSMAVEKLHPDARSVIELGGQDAKIILFKHNPESDEKHVFTSMNDKCASGTGATIDKCVMKVGLSNEELVAIDFDCDSLHHVAAKCGVFAETDIVNLIKAGVPAPEIMNSLADAIVMQNLSVLTRGNILEAKVLLLGGPNTFLPFLRQAWSYRLPEVWRSRGYQAPDLPLDELIMTPADSQYYAAYGALVYGCAEGTERKPFKGSASLREFIRQGKADKQGHNHGSALLKPGEDLNAFLTQYRPPPFEVVQFPARSTIEAFIGLDGGSTSSKGVLIDAHGKVLIKAYQLSRGNPIQDAKELLAQLADYARSQACGLKIRGVGVTGYAADILFESLSCDISVVETVAHMRSAQHFCGDDIDVVCDIGGQDIKVLFLQNRQVKNFRLSNQCSAGNGMLLQAMADQFGIALEDYAKIAFQAKRSPKFSYGCAVFLDSDRVNFQKEGYSREELFAGLAQVLPKNVWQYVVQIPRMADLGRNFVLQGGTQYNLAAVKAQVDYILERVPGANIEVHPHCGEAGAIGAALEAKQHIAHNKSSRFIGIDAAVELEFTTRTDSETRCTYCENYCSRTFIDTRIPNGDSRRHIAGFACEKGRAETKQEVLAVNKARKAVKKQYPNLVDYESQLMFRFKSPGSSTNPAPSGNPSSARNSWLRLAHRLAGRRVWAKASTIQVSNQLRVGIPRCLNHFTVAPFLRAYLHALGVAHHNIVFSDETSEELWLEGGKLGAIDPCFPAKASLAHVHHLLSHRKYRHKPFDYIWFPNITHYPGVVSDSLGESTCPVVSGTPAVVRAAFTKERDLFAQSGAKFIDGALDFTDTRLLQSQLYKSWGKFLGMTKVQNSWACEQALHAEALCSGEMQRRGLELLLQAEREQSLVLLMLGRPYHNDSGLNHRVFDEFQSLAYPVISIRSIPKQPDYLQRFFQHDLNHGLIGNVFDISDVWPENFSVNSTQKVWAAKFAARHPNVAVVDLSSFKCGQDAPTYGIIDSILSAAKTPFLNLHDLDANKPSGSLKIRIRTFDYVLQRYRRTISETVRKRSNIERLIDEKRIELINEQLQEVAQRDSERHLQMEHIYHSCLVERERSMQAAVAEAANESRRLRRAEGSISR